MNRVIETKCKFCGTTRPYNIKDSESCNHEFGCLNDDCNGICMATIVEGQVLGEHWWIKYT